MDPPRGLQGIVQYIIANLGRSKSMEETFDFEGFGWED
jgi:hypothetical protein